MAERQAETDGDTPQAEARTFEILIRTEILSPDPQAGMKSEQMLVVDFGAQTVTSSYRTGTTSVPLIGDIGSVRDSFRVTKVVFAKPDPVAVSFSVTGETATGVLIVPNINYQMDFEVQADGSVAVSGDHDGYPAYFVSRNGATFYTYRHRPMEVLRLAGSSDVTMSTSTIGPL